VGDRAADDRAAVDVVVLCHRRHQPRLVARLRLEAVRALHDAPAVVLAAAAGRGLEVDLLPLRLADVAEEQVAGLSVERVRPGVAQPVRPGLRPPAGLADPRVGRRDDVRRAIRGRRLDVKPQHLGVDERRVLAAPVGVVVRPAVAEPEVKVAILRPEFEVAAVVQLVRLGVDQQYLLGAHVGGAPVGFDVHAHEQLVAGLPARPARVGGVVGHVEVRLLGVAGRERQAQQPTLPAGDHVRLDVEERLGLDGTVLVDDPDASVLLEHEKAPRAVASVDDPDRELEPRGDLLRAERGRRLRRDRNPGRRGGHTDHPHLAPADLARGDGGAHHHPRQHARRVDGNGERLAVGGVDVVERLVQLEQAIGTTQVDLVRRRAGGILRDDQLEPLDERRLVQRDLEPLRRVLPGCPEGVRAAVDRVLRRLRVPRREHVAGQREVARRGPRRWRRARARRLDASGRGGQEGGWRGAGPHARDHEKGECEEEHARQSPAFYRSGCRLSPW
jgi:hypothetical protein